MTCLCICMSPAIDASVALDKAPKGDGEIFKNVKVEENAGGKTINVARWLAIRSRGLGGPTVPVGRAECATGTVAPPVICAGLLGEDNAEPFVKEFAKYGIIDRMTRVPGSTRRNEMITWPGGSFKLNQSAFAGVSFDEAAFLSGLTSVLQTDTQTLKHSNTQTLLPVVIISGSLPKCCGNDFYAKAVAAFKAKGAFVVLDASGEAMKLALEAGPDLVKPNAEECEPLVGFVPKTPDDFRRATELLRKKSAHVVISDGGAGAWFDGEFVPAPAVDVVDTTAAGDTLLAEYCWQLFGDGSQTGGLRHESGGAALRAARFAVAAGSAACTMPGSQAPTVEQVERLKASL